MIFLNNKRALALALSLSVLIPAMIPLFISPGSTQDIDKRLKNKILKGPGIKILTTVQDCRKFQDIMIHPNRYILSNSKIVPFPPPIVYDIYTKKLRTINIREMQGMPKPPKNLSKTDRLKMKRLGKYWWLTNIELIYYNPANGTAGVLIEKTETLRTVQGNPICPLCSEKSKLVEKYQRYYCYKCRKYVKKEVYLKDVRSYYYAGIDLGSKRVAWITPIAKGSFYSIGVDPDGKYFYFYDSISFYKRVKTPDKFSVYRFNISSRRIDWRYSISIPVRYKKNSPGSYSMRFFPSPDFSKIVFWEYDEIYDRKTRKGWLKNPQAQAYIIDIPSKSHFSVPIPVTPYGQLIDRENRYLLLGSNQLGMLFRFDLNNKKQDKRVRASRNIFKLILSAHSRYLYVFTKNKVEVRSWPSLKLIKNIPLKRIFPGITKLLVSEPVYVTQDGRFAAIGVLKKGRSGPWASSSHDDGFHLLMIGD